MIRHSLKMIWADRRSNGWVLIELIVVFSILWFCSGFIYDKGKQFLEPVGVDINHTYLLRFDYRKDIKQEDYSKEYDYAQDGQTILERLKHYPGIENCCFSANRSTPYSGSYSARSIEKDSINYNIVNRPVSPEYFDVFKIKFQAGKAFDSNEVTSKNQVVASPDENNTFFKEEIINLKEIVIEDIDPAYHPKTDEEWKNAPRIDNHLQVTGVVNKIKRSEYEPYERIAFEPMSLSNLNPREVDICIRVKSEADKGFVDKFRKEMGEQLKVGPFEMVSIRQLSERRESYLRDAGYQEKIETVFVIVSFLLINVFLGITGTFRFRTNARRGEIGLRCALGSSKNKIKQLLLTETFLMLVLASIPGTIIALNVQIMGILPKLGVTFLEMTKNNLITTGEPIGQSISELSIYLITYLITFVMMLVIIWLGTWYPAKKASEIQPAEALHYE